MHQKFPQPPKALRVLALILICLVCGVAAMGQESNGAVPVRPDTASTLKPPATAGEAGYALPNGRATAPANTANNYKSSYRA